MINEQPVCEFCGSTPTGDPSDWGLACVYDASGNEHIVCFVCADTCVELATDGCDQLNQEGEERLQSIRGESGA